MFSRLVFALALAAAPTHPYSVQDQVTMRRIGDPSVSPDGKRIAYVLRTTDLEANRGRTDLWLVDSEGRASRQLTFSPESEAQPTWSPDGQSLFFLSTRGGSSQVFRLPLEGGEARPVTTLPLDVGAFRLSRDGKWLAVALEVFPDCATLECTVQRAADVARDRHVRAAILLLIRRGLRMGAIPRVDPGVVRRRLLRESDRRHQEHCAAHRQADSSRARV